MRLVEVDVKIRSLEEEYNAIKTEAEMQKKIGNMSKYRSLVAKANDITKHIKWLKDLPVVSYDNLNDVKKKNSSYKHTKDINEKSIPHIMRECRRAIEEVKHYSCAHDYEAMYIEKEHTAKKLGCKQYIHCEMDDLYLFYLSGYGFKPIIGNGGGEYVITADNYLIDVTGNSLSAIEKEVYLGTAAYGYIGIVEDIWHADSFQKLLSETDMQPKRITVFDILRNITSEKYFTNQIFSLIQGIKSEEELLEKIAREFSKEQAAVVMSAAKKGYPLSLEGLQK